MVRVSCLAAPTPKQTTTTPEPTTRTVRVSIGLPTPGPTTTINANQDDGMCEYWGCTDPNAINYDETNTNDGNCEYSEAFFSVDQDFGCGSLTVTVNNQTTGTDAGSCSFNMGDGTVIESCDTSFEHTYSDLGEYTITYTFVVSDVVSEYSLTVNVYPEAITPEVAWDVDAGLFSCTNCAGNETSWQTGEEMGTEGSYAPEVDEYTLVSTNPNGCGHQYPIPVVFGCLDPFAVNAEANANAENCTYLNPRFWLPQPRAVLNWRSP